MAIGVVAQVWLKTDKVFHEVPQKMAVLLRYFHGFDLGMDVRAHDASCMIESVEVFPYSF